MKTCSKCKRELPKGEFYSNRHTESGYHLWCKSCMRAYSNSYRLKNRVIVLKHQREYHSRNKDMFADRSYKRLYGIGRLDRQDMLTWQGYKCAICRIKENGKKLHIDHDKVTRQVRMLLCVRCNSGTGIKDDSILLRAKAEYIEAYES